MGSKVITPRKVGSPDFTLILVTLALLSLGIVMVLSSSVGHLVGISDSLDKTDIYKYGKQQIIWAALGLVIMFFFSKINHKLWKKFAPAIILVGIITLILVYIPSLGGQTQRGSARWLNLGFMTIQPSESIKLALAIFLASTLAERGVKTLRDVSLPIGVVVVCVGMVVAQPDLGTTVVIFCTAASMFFAAGIRLRYFLGGLGLGAAGSFAVIMSTDYMMERVRVWLDPWKFVSGKGYQSVNALLALGSGGVIGVGLGQGMQKYGHVPENHTDMIFAIIGEELGLLGTGVVILLFALFIWRGLSIANNADNLFSRYLAVGITCMIGFQTLINLGVVTGLVPVTGVTLPFISYGGSSLTLKLATVGILLNISRYAKSKSEALDPTFVKSQGRFSSHRDGSRDS